jgi:hypothetical protein
MAASGAAFEKMYVLKSADDMLVEVPYSFIAMSTTLKNMIDGMTVRGLVCAAWAHSCRYV